MTLKDCIEEIISTFCLGNYFDSHTIIHELIKNKKYHSIYLQEYPKNSDVTTYHSSIAKTIGQCGGVHKAGRSKSHSIYGELVENTLWQKE